MPGCVLCSEKECSKSANLYRLVGCRAPPKKKKSDSKDHSIDIIYFSKSVVLCLRYLVVIMIPNNNKNCKPRTSVNSLSLLHRPLGSDVFVIHELRDSKNQSRLVAGKAEIHQIPEPPQPCFQHGLYWYLTDTVHRWCS